MNVQHPDMLRQGVPNMHQSIINQPFFPQSQPGQQSPPHNMGPFQNNQGGNPSLGLMGGQPGASNAGYPLNMQQAPPGRRPGMFMAPHPGGPAPSSLNAPGGGGGPSHMGGLGSGQLQNMSSFPGGNIIRRVQSQPMNPNGAHLGIQPGMQPGMQHGMQPGMQPGMMGGGMARTPMTASQQQQQHQMLQLRQQQQAQLQAQGGGIPSEMGLPMNRPAHLQTAGSMPHARTASGQALMPTSMSQHGMQQQIHQQLPHSGYSNPMSLQHQPQHQPSPHIGGQQQPQLASQTPAGRQMASENPMFMNFQNQPIRPPTIHGIPQIPNNPQFNVNFNASPTPPNLGGDMSQRGNPATQGPIASARARRRRATTAGVGAHAGGGAGARHVERGVRVRGCVRGCERERAGCGRVWARARASVRRRRGLGLGLCGGGGRASGCLICADDLCEAGELNRNYGRAVGLYWRGEGRRALLAQGRAVGLGEDECADS